MTPDERKAQIEALAKAWEALGDMHMANETWLGEDGDHDELVTQFQRGCKIVADFYHYAPGGNFDTADATPCLALLIDALGPDYDIWRSKQPDGSLLWRVRHLLDKGSFGFRESEVSRIHAVTLALEVRP